MYQQMEQRSMEIPETFEDSIFVWVKKLAFVDREGVSPIFLLESQIETLGMFPTFFRSSVF